MRQSRSLSLEPIATGDLPFLYRIAIDENASFRWRYRGTVPSYEQFVSSLNAGVYTQFVVMRRHTATPIGHAIAYGADANAGFLFVALLARTEGLGRLGVESFLLFARHLFSCAPLYKIYLEVPSYNLGQFESAVNRRYLTLEGVLRGHIFADGSRHDMNMYAVYRDQASAAIDRYGRELGIMPLARSVAAY